MPIDYAAEFYVIFNSIFFLSFLRHRMMWLNGERKTDLNRNLILSKRIQLLQLLVPIHSFNYCYSERIRLIGQTHVHRMKKLSRSHLRESEEIESLYDVWLEYSVFYRQGVHICIRSRDQIDRRKTVSSINADTFPVELNEDEPDASPILCSNGKT